MTCEECRDLETHRFRTPADLVHAFQTAAAEMERGVLRRIELRELTASEREAMYSVLAADALPGAMRYRFECTVCRDRFELWGNTETGEGAWTRGEAV